MYLYYLPVEREYELKDRSRVAYETIFKAVDVGTFILSDEAITRLKQYKTDMDKAWQDAEENPCVEYLETTIILAEICLEDIIEIANRDLKSK